MLIVGGMITAASVYTMSPFENAVTTFQMYGYQVNKVGYPSYYMNTRKKWNYIKTVGCVVLGNIPLEDKREIETIYNNGITFWHGDITFQYDVENTIV